MYDGKFFRVSPVDEREPDASNLNEGGVCKGYVVIINTVFFYQDIYTFYCSVIWCVIVMLSFWAFHMSDQIIGLLKFDTLCYHLL